MTSPMTLGSYYPRCRRIWDFSSAPGQERLIRIFSSSKDGGPRERYNYLFLLQDQRKEYDIYGIVNDLETSGFIIDSLLV